MKRIVGIDPGSRITGYGVLDAEGGHIAHVASGCIKVAAGGLAGRLHALHAGLAAMLAEFRPDAVADGYEMAIEQVFLHRNVSSALKLGHARGVALLSGVQAGLEVHEYSATAVKQAVTGRGHADKEQVQHMIRVMLGLRRAPAADASDALAVAVCHAHTRATELRLGVTITAPAKGRHRRSRAAWAALAAGRGTGT